MDKEVNVLAMVKGEERFVFLYDDQNRVETLRMLGRFAADPQLSFSWYDAAIMSKKIREMSASEEAKLHDEDLLPPKPGKSHRRRSLHSRFDFSHEEDFN